MYKDEFSGTVISKIISELEGFRIFLCSSKVYMDNVTALPTIHKKNSIKEIQTHVSKYQTVCRFISWLIDSYITPHFMLDDFEKTYNLNKTLHSYLSLSANNHSKFRLGNKNKNLYKSLTNEQLRDFVYLFKLPAKIEKDSDGRMTASAYVRFRNLILVKLLTQYGLRIGETLLLRESSFKLNMAETIAYMYVANLDDGVDPRKNKPSIKTRNSIRELKISMQDYKIIKMFMMQVKLRASHNFLFSSSIGECPPLTYKAAYKIIIDASEIMKDKFPAYFDQTKAEFLENVHPHMLRHTWAYMQLKNLYYQVEKQFIKAGAVNTKGIMASAKDMLRQLGGWSENSVMPNHYAERFIAESANEKSLKMFDEHFIETFETLDIPRI